MYVSLSSTLLINIKNIYIDYQRFAQYLIPSPVFFSCVRLLFLQMGEPARHIENHQVNPNTGFIENPGFASQFDSQRKLAFLKLYKQNGIRLRRACRSMGLSEATVSSHLRTDPKFREMFDEVEKDYLEELEATSRENALNPRSVIERIFQLKCLIPEKYGQENRPSTTSVTINVDGELLKAIAQRDRILDATPLPQNSESVAELSQQANAS